MDNQDQNGGRKRSYGKWIGGGLGWAFGGPLGAIIGFALGSLFGNNSNSQEYVGQTSQQRDFNVSLLVLSAAVMKADGSVKKSELSDDRGSLLYSEYGSASRRDRGRKGAVENPPDGTYRI